MDFFKLLTQISFVVFVGLVLASSVLVNISTTAQTKTNGIGLAIAKINQLKDGKLTSLAVTSDPANQNAYSTTGVLTPDDDIRYRWGSGFLLSKDNIGAAAKANSGYIKVFLGKEASEANFIANAGQNLPLADLRSKLVAGDNTILLQVVTNEGKPITPATELTLTFKYSSESTKPGIEIVSPKAKAVLAPTIIQSFDISTPNFTLVNDPTAKSSSNSGKMAIYWDEVTSEKLIAVVYQNQFKSSDYDFSKIQDGNDRKLIFVLKDSKDVEYSPSIRAELPVRANYQGTIDIGLPKVTIVQPDKTATNLDLSEDDKIIVQVDNFELVDNTTDKNTENGKGVLQVSIDGRKVGESLSKKEFVLSELSIGDLTSGEKELTVELVEKNFEKLNPIASDTLKFNYVPQLLKLDTASESNTQAALLGDSQNPAWRIVIVILIVILIIGGIAVLITKA